MPCSSLNFFFPPTQIAEELAEEKEEQEEAEIAHNTSQRSERDTPPSSPRFTRVCAWASSSPLSDKKSVCL